MGLKMKFGAIVLGLGAPFAYAQTGNFYLDWADKYEFLLLRTTPKKERITFAAVKCSAVANLLKGSFPSEERNVPLYDKVITQASSQITKNYPEPQHAHQVVSLIGKDWAKVHTHDRIYNKRKYDSDINELKGFASGCADWFDKAPK